MGKDKLAIDDGPPVRKTPFPAWPFFSNDEINSVSTILRSGQVNYWTGLEGRLFESEFATYIGCNYAIALANGTLALELALYALDVGPGDEVITTCRTFIASASCIVMRGAIPIFADVNADSQNISVDSIRRCITSRTKAIICVHLAGWPCEMDSILKLASEFGLKVIEDCAQAHGATYNGRSVGSFGDVAAFSFCQDKIMSTGGEGGMLVTNNEKLWLRAWEYKDHGKSFDAVFNRQHPHGFRWLHDSFGTNFRLTEMQSAIGRLQLSKLSEWIRLRQHYASILSAHFSSVSGIRTALPPLHIGHSYYRYYVFVKPDFLKLNWNRDRIVAAVNAEGVPCFSGSCSEVYLENAFKGMRPLIRLPIAKDLGETSIAFLVHPTLSEVDVVDICNAVDKVMLSASRI